MNRSIVGPEPRRRAESADRARTGRPSLSPYGVLWKDLLHWLSRYLEHKTMTLGNHRANIAELEDALSEVHEVAETSERVVPDLFDLKRLESRVRKAGVGISTQFHPCWLFVQWSESNIAKGTRIEDMTEEPVIRFLTIQTSSKSGQTKTNYRRALSEFFAFISKRNAEGVIVDVDLSSWQKNAGNAALSPPDHLSSDEVERLLLALDDLGYGSAEKDRYLQPLYSFLFRMILFSGVRISEALSMSMDHFKVLSKRDAEIVVVAGKGNYFRKIRVPYGCSGSDSDRLGIYCLEPWFREMINARKERGAINPDFRNRKIMFLDEKGSPLYRRKASIVLKKALDAAGIHKSKMGPHLLRHTYASLLYARTRDILLVQRVLGHKSISMTQRYTHLWDDDLSRAAEAIRIDTT